MTQATESLRERTQSNADTNRLNGVLPDRLLLALLDEAKELLAAVGVRLSIVSLDEDRSVLISEPASDQVSVPVACELSRRALGRVTGTARGPKTELVELRCGRRSEWPCTFSLEWSQQRPAPSAPAEIPSLEMLIGGQGHGVDVAWPTMAEPITTQTTPSQRSDDTPQAPPASVEGEPPAAERPSRFRSRRLFPPWLRRRWWLLVLCGLAGIGGGYLARSSAKPTYSASSEIVVSTGAGEKGPGDANDAIALALTDASILPSDQALLQTVSQEIGTSTSSVASHLSSSVETGTSVILVTFQGSTPQTAIRGANAVARAVTARDEESSAIPNGSLALVQLANGASTSGMLFTYGLPLGALLGLLIGFVFVVAIERADPRVDDVDELAQATGTAANAYPGPISLEELEQLIGRAGAGASAATLVPLSEAELAQTLALRQGLESADAPQPMAIDVAGPIGSTEAPLSRGTAPTVLVVRGGARLRKVQETAQRLELLGRRPVWSVLAVGKRTRRSWR